MLQGLTGNGYGGSERLYKLDKIYEVLLRYSRFNDDPERFSKIIDDNKKTMDEKCKELYDIYDN